MGKNPCVSALLRLVYNGSIYGTHAFVALSFGRYAMAWTTPKVLEICVGLEINSYACAEI
jgi:coenzyme PQQ precursor peptide PqqA